ncbi:hypothetical protein B0H12DRAFT_1307066 [Mycena haematopus]|nr:hypothetical protein B0H12DRAFT_1307066 [Mycena haematopus]
MNAPLVPKPISSPSQVQESRTKRLVRQQARFRDRGGIFVPRTHNNLLDILLGRKKLSPFKRRSRSRSLSVSPTKKPKSRGLSVGRKSGGTVSKPAPKRKAKTSVDDDQPVAGPSRLPNDPVKKPRKAALSRKKTLPAVSLRRIIVLSGLAPTNTSTTKPKAKRKINVMSPEDSTAQDSDNEESINTTKPKAKRKTKAIPLEDPTAQDDEARPGPSKKRTTAKSSRKPVQTDDTGEGEVSAKPKRSAKSAAKTEASAPKAKPRARSAKNTPVDATAPPPRTQRSRAAKSRPMYAELSDDDGEETSWAKNVAAAIDSASVMSSKRMGKQREAKDTAETAEVGKTAAKREHQAEVEPKAKKGAKKSAAQQDLPEDDGDTKGKGRGKSGEETDKVAVKPKVRKRPALLEVDDDDDDNRPAKKRKAAPQQRLEAIPEEDEETVASVNTPVQVQRADPKISVASAASKPKKRLRDKNEDVAETARKRAKVGEVEAKAAPPAAPKKRAPGAKRSKPAPAPASSDEKAKPARIPSKTLKENTPTSPAAKSISVYSLSSRHLGPLLTALFRLSGGEDPRRAFWRKFVLMRGHAS